MLEKGQIGKCKDLNYFDKGQFVLARGKHQILWGVPSTVVVATKSGQVKTISDLVTSIQVGTNS